MQFGRAFGYITQDPEWVSKLVQVAVLGFLSYIPLFGLVAVAALLGYLVEIVANIRARRPMPLPVWNNFEGKLTLGAPVLVALVVYNLPTLLLFGCLFTTPSLLSGALGSSVTVLMLLCVVPFTLIFTALSWSMLAVGLTRYATDHRADYLYRFGLLWAAIFANSGAVAQWGVFALFVNMILTVLALIPCLGWVVIPLLAIPVHGHLLGQFALVLDAKR